MVDNDLPGDSPDLSDDSSAAPAKPTPRRGPGHRADMRDTVAEMAERAQQISMEAGSKIASAMKDVIAAAAGIAGFAIESARDVVQYMVRRGQMTPEEAERIIREAEAAHAMRSPEERARPTASKVAADQAAAAKAAAALNPPPEAPVHRPFGRPAAPAVKPAPTAPAPAPVATPAKADPVPSAAAKKAAPAAKAPASNSPAAKTPAPAPAKAAAPAKKAAPAAKAPAKAAPAAKKATPAKSGAAKKATATNTKAAARPAKPAAKAPAKAAKPAKKK